MNKLEISDVSINKIISWELENTLPELYKLKECIEHNPWHMNTSVFEHTIEVLEELEKIIKVNKDSNLDIYLEKKIDNYSKKDLLYLWTLFHDISKNDTFSYEKWFWTKCPWHEEQWAIKVENILKKFDLSNIEKIFVKNLIRYHWKIHYILYEDNLNLNNEVNEHKNKYEAIYIELIILALADTIASDLKISDKINYDFRIKFYMDIILNFKLKNTWKN